MRSDKKYINTDYVFQVLDKTEFCFCPRTFKNKLLFICCVCSVNSVTQNDCVCQVTNYNLKDMKTVIIIQNTAKIIQLKVQVHESDNFRF